MHVLTVFLAAATTPVLLFCRLLLSLFDPPVLPRLFTAFPAPLELPAFAVSPTFPALPFFLPFFLAFPEFPVFPVFAAPAPFRFVALPTVALPGAIFSTEFESRTGSAGVGSVIVVGAAVVAGATGASGASGAAGAAGATSASVVAVPAAIVTGAAIMAGAAPSEEEVEAHATAPLPAA